jgi:hypothetical protein
MSFYRNDEPGKRIEFSKAEELIRENRINLGNRIGSTLLSGFLSADILNELLDDGSACVGIRLYSNVDVLFVAVFEEGDELEENSRGMPGYVVSRSNGEYMQFDRVTRRFAADSVRNSWKILKEMGGTDIAFASYFSAQVIRELLQTEDCNGIMFYTIGLLKNGKFPFTHMAVPAKHTPLIGIELRGQTGDCVICPDPCPPRRAPAGSIRFGINNIPLTKSELRAAIKAIKPPDNIVETTDGAKYLIAWQ